ncbi:DEAD/DEAH box helicase family protein [Roseibium salinum]|uniref:DEAD/DEAH box helicase family protein n=1 Tax=Roseibium salinum TaxID=1604349 RepID=A0ABT3R5U0_9HYPH|nr:DEAD/DEAH box helicase family protein [Roseibium sp. DSM 29163]MCX2724501.1 DEAD/DEAH box helicase family protein [Roseibium sp. DSM 29163]MDN3721504.1 DEAD/DEAH box helicase family protein [Roseibium salinum]
MKMKFAEAMERRWINELGLKANPALIEGWKQLHAAVAGQPLADHWSAVQLPTGAGKTQAIALMCSRYEELEHPGALIVTRFRSEANSLADQINDIAETPIAVACHSENDISCEAMKRHPVLIITHSAFEQALKAVADGRKLTSRLHDFKDWKRGTRAWTIIDEMPNFVEPLTVSLNAIEAMVTELDRIQSLSGTICHQQLKRFLNKLRSADNATQQNRVLTAEEMNLLRDIWFDELDNDLWLTPERHFTSGEPHELRGVEVRSGYMKVVSCLEKLSQLDVLWKSSQRGIERLNGARLLFKYAGSSGVILDATASTDPAYELLGDRIKILPRPEGIRDYSNVRLNLSYGHRVGKEHMCSNGREEWSRVLEALKRDLDEGRRVLAISHKDNVPVLQTFGHFDGELSVAHWGALDGKNNWADFDSALLFGLPSLDNVTPTNLFLGCVGTLTNEWLSGDREYGVHADIQQALKDGFTIRSVVQAINRVRCRQAINEHGECERTDIYVLMPKGAKGDKIVSAIQEQMPGIQVLSWKKADKVPPARKQLTLHRLVEHLKQLKPGTYTKREVMQAANIAKRSFDRLSRKLQDPTTSAYKRLAELNVDYACAIGGAQAQFIVS